MEKLTIKNELKLLEKAFMKHEYIGKGSSRAVFGLDDYNVIKVVADDGGMLQNKLEAETYERYRSNKLATVKAVGRFVLVMERVDADSYREDDDFYDVQDYLEDITGRHGDNYQIGTALDGRRVAYDYGFNVKQCDKITDMIGDVGWYIKRLGSPYLLLRETKRNLIKTIFG